MNAALPEKVFVLNGRHRFYRLDTTMQRRLRRRRVLAETRIVEIHAGSTITGEQVGSWPVLIGSWANQIDLTIAYV